MNPDPDFQSALEKNCFDFCYKEANNFSTITRETVVVVSLTITF